MQLNLQLKKSRTPMNYQHLYHAGNFSDVVKHIVLISLIEFLKQKEKPFCYLETHAGSGLYDLQTIEANKTQEYKNGILKLFNKFVLETGKENKKNDFPEIIKTYLEIVKENGFPNTYPGSPLIAKHCLRPQDSMILLELHPEEVKNLKSLFRNQKNSAIHHQDGYQGLKAFLPPKERRGLILIDPPYEKNDEWEQTITTLELSLKRFPAGVYAIWYPLKDKAAVNQFQRQLKTLKVEKKVEEIVVIELTVHPEDIEFGLIGCGMAILNPPWQWQEYISKVIPWLWERLSEEGEGSYKMYKISNAF